MTVPSTEPWGMPLVTGLQLDLMLLFTNIWAQPIRQFSAYLIFHFPNLYFVSLPTRVLGDSMKNIIQLKLNNIHCYPSSTKAVISLYKVIRMVKHNFPYINPCSSILPWHLAPVIYTHFKAEFFYKLCWGSRCLPELTSGVQLVETILGCRTMGWLWQGEGPLCLHGLCGGYQSPEQQGSHLPRSYWDEEETRVLESWGLTLGAGCSVGMG